MDNYLSQIILINQLNINFYCSVFPVTTDVPFPKSFINLCRKILTRLFRVFVHVYIHHFDRIVSIGAVGLIWFGKTIKFGLFIFLFCICRRLMSILVISIFITLSKSLNWCRPRSSSH